MKDSHININGWICFTLGTIGFLSGNYFVIMFARIFWSIGTAIILGRLFGWVQIRKIYLTNKS